MVRNNGKCLLIMVFIYTEKEIKMNYQAKVVSLRRYVTSGRRGLGESRTRLWSDFRDVNLGSPGA